MARYQTIINKTHWRYKGDPWRSGLSGVSTRFGIAGDESKRGPWAVNRVGGMGGKLSAANGLPESRGDLELKICAGVLVA